MTKKFIALAAVLAFGLPFAASAATISNPLFSNGDTTIDASGGATVSGTFTLTVNAGEVCEWLRTQSDPSQPFTDISVGGQLGYQEQVYTNIPFTVKVPPNTGTVFPTVQCAGIFGGNRAINGGDNVVVGPTGLGTVRVVAIGGSSSSVPSVGGASDDFWTKLAQVIAAVFKAQEPTTPPAPAKPAGCAGVVAFNGYNASEAQASLFAVDAGRAVFNASGVYAPTGHFKSVSGQAAAAVAIACK